SPKKKCAPTSPAANGTARRAAMPYRAAPRVWSRGFRAVIRVSSACRCSKRARCSGRRAVPLAEWLIEDGIGEHRAIRIDGETIAEARVHWPGELVAGTVADAVLVSRAKGSSRGTARFASGQEALVDRLPASASEGSPIRL